jgi:hypothetical protein
MDIRLRYLRRKEKQAELGSRYQWDCVVKHLASGTLSIVTIELGATLIVDGSHVEASPEEVAVHQEQQRREGERIASQGRQISRMNHRPDSKDTDPNGRRYEFV